MQSASLSFLMQGPDACVVARVEALVTSSVSNIRADDCVLGTGAVASRVSWPEAGVTGVDVPSGAEEPMRLFLSRIAGLLLVLEDAFVMASEVGQQMSLGLIVGLVSGGDLEANVQSSITRSDVKLGAIRVTDMLAILDPTAIFGGLLLRMQVEGASDFSR